jgi:hypothetical protein
MKTFKDMVTLKECISNRINLPKKMLKEVFKQKEKMTRQKYRST